MELKKNIQHLLFDSGVVTNLKTAQTYAHNIYRLAEYYKCTNIEGVNALTFNQINHFFQMIVLQNVLKQNTLSQMFYSFESYFKKYLKKDYPFDKVKKIERERRIVDILTFDEIKSVFNNCKDSREKSIFAIIYSCGLEVDELRELKISDVLFDEQIILIKKKTEVKQFVLSKYLSEIIQDYILQYRPQKWLFEGHKMKPLSKRAIQNDIFDLGVRANITKEFTPKILKYCYIRHFPQYFEK